MSSLCGKGTMVLVLAWLNSIPTWSKFNPNLFEIPVSYRLRMGSWLGRGVSTINEGFVLFVDHFLHCLVKQINPRLAIVIGQSWCSFKSLIAIFLHCYYERPKWCYFLLNATYDWLILTMTYSTVPLQSPCWHLMD